MTNVDWDHVDCYPTPAAFDEAFRKFVGQIPPEGMLVVCADDPAALALRDAVAEGVRVETYGLPKRTPTGRRATWRRTSQGGFDAEVWHGGEHVADLSLPVPGRHNVRNALAALAVANWHHINPRLAAKMLHDFHGAGRRFEFIGEAGGVIVIDDYAHHPTEVGSDSVGRPAALPDPAHLGRVPAAHLQPDAGAAAGLRAQLRRCGPGAAARHLCGPREDRPGHAQPAAACRVWITKAREYVGAIEAAVEQLAATSSRTMSSSR